MINIHDLEKRWLRYKIKSYIPHGVIALSILIIAVVTSLTFNTATPTPKPSQEKNIVTKPIMPTKVVQKEQEQPRPKPVLQPVTLSQHNPMKLQPSLGFMKEMQQTSLPFYTENVPETTISNTPTPSPVKKQPSTVDVDTLPEPPKEPEVHRVMIKKRDARHDIAAVIKRFQSNQNPALSLFIAKQYYDLGEYKKAYNYALITNKLNSEIEDSWLIFAKSLVKLGEKKMAMKTLQEYIQSSDSQNAQILLEDIKSGKFQ